MKRRSFFGVVLGAVASFIPVFRHWTSKECGHMELELTGINHMASNVRGHGILKVYDGLMPAGPNDQPGLLLAEIEFAEPPIGNPQRAQRRTW